MYSINVFHQVINSNNVIKKIHSNCIGILYKKAFFSSAYFEYYNNILITKNKCCVYFSMIFRIMLIHIVITFKLTCYITFPKFYKITKMQFHFNLVVHSIAYLHFFLSKNVVFLNLEHTILKISPNFKCLKKLSTRVLLRNRTFTSWKDIKCW